MHEIVRRWDKNEIFDIPYVAASTVTGTHTHRMTTITLAHALKVNHIGSY